MALGNSTLQIVPYFDYTALEFRIQDSYDYAGESIPLTQLKGVYKLTNPASIVIRDAYTSPVWGSPDIDHDVDTDSAEIDISNYTDDETGKILAGDYVIDYKLQRQLGSIDVNSFTANNEFELDGEYDWLDAGGTVVITGSSSNDGTYTVVSAVAGGGVTTVTVEGTGVSNENPTSGVAQITMVYTKQFTFCYDFDAPSFDLNISHDCSTLKLSVSDDTEYPSGDTIVSRSGVLKYPVKGNGDHVASDGSWSTETTTFSPLWTGTYIAALTVVGQRTLDSGAIVDYTLSGSEDHDVVCATSLRNIYSCIKSVIDKFNEACACGKPSSQFLCDVQYILSEYMLLMVAREKSDEDAVSTHVTNICSKVSDLGCECSCTDGTSEPVLVSSALVQINLDALDVNYDNTTSALTAETVQAAIDELENEIDAVLTSIGDLTSNYTTLLALRHRSVLGVDVNTPNNNILIDLGEYLLANGQGIVVELQLAPTAPSSQLVVTEVDSSTTLLTNTIGNNPGRYVFFWMKLSDSTSRVGLWKPDGSAVVANASIDMTNGDTEINFNVNGGGAVTGYYWQVAENMSA